jgi:Four helix bundle sensory module for signal transduction
MVLILLMIVGVVGWRLIAALTSEHGSLSQDNLDRAVYLSNAQNALWQLRYGFPQLLVLGAEDRAQVVADEPKWYQQINESMQGYIAGSHTPEELKAFNAFQEISTKYIQARLHWFQLLNEGKAEPAAEWRAQTITPYGRAASESLERLINLQPEVVAAKDLETEAAAATAIWTMIGATIFVLAIGMSLAFFLAHSI